MEHIFETVYPEYKIFKDEIETNSKQFLNKTWKIINFYFSFNNKYLYDNIIIKKEIFKYNVDLKINNKIYKVFPQNLSYFYKEEQVSSQSDNRCYIRFLKKDDFFKFLNDIGCKFDMILQGTYFYNYQSKKNLIKI